MSFDGRYYLGAAPVPPMRHLPHAAAAAELPASLLVGGYFTSIHQATLIGTQPYLLRRRRAVSPSNLRVATWSNLAEWCAVHLPEHVTELVAEVWVGAVSGPLAATLRARIVVEWDGDTFEGEAFELFPEQAAPVTVAGLDAYQLFPRLVLPSLGDADRPTVEARVRVQGYAANSDGPTDFTPLDVTAWRLTR